MEEVMKKIYYAPENTGGFGGIQKLKQAVFENTGIRLADSDVEKWLLKQDIYTLYKTAPVHFKRNRVLVNKIDWQFQVDLVDMAAYSSENDGVRYLLTCIDLFSKYAWVRCLKNKSGKHVTAAFKDILEEGRIPHKLQTDEGKEFLNREFDALIRKNKIIHFTTSNETKASVIERFNRTLKTKMWKYLAANNSKRYVDVLQDLVSAYNRSYHRSIKMKPAEVTKDNEHIVFNNLYKAKDKGMITFKFKAGDTVRISKLRSPFKKGYEQNYTDEYFTVMECLHRRPPVYRLKDYDGEILQGTFYEPELQKVIVDKNKTFKIEKVLSRKRRQGQNMVLVKWVGWPDKFNTWISEKQLIQLP